MVKLDTADAVAWSADRAVQVSAHHEDARRWPSISTGTTTIAGPADERLRTVPDPLSAGVPRAPEAE